MTRQDIMAQILHKRSSTSAKVPQTTDLVLGELAINTYDGKLFTKKNNGSADTMVEIGAHTFTGDVTGGGNGTIAMTLANSGVVAGTWTKVSVDAKGRVTTGANLSSSDITTTLGFTPENVANKNVANGYAGLGSDGKLPSNLLPALAITDTFVVGSDAAMTALSAQTGDIAIRTDETATFILKGSDPTILANWQQILSPVGSSNVSSVNGKIGNVTLTTSDIAEVSNLYYTDARARSATLVGLTATDNSPITASDTFIYALGRLQAQINNRATSGANSNITSLTGLTTALSITQGGTGATTAAGIKTNLVLDRVENKSSQDIRNDIGAADVTRAIGYNPTRGASFASSTSELGISANDIRTVTNPLASLGYAGGVRFRFAAANDIDGSNGYADVMDLSTYHDNTGGGFNALYFNKGRQSITHKFAGADGTSWNVKTLAYAEDVLPLSGGYLTGPLYLGAAQDLHLRSNISNDIGDIVFDKADGTEKHRIWDAGDHLNYRYNNGTGYVIMHSGNVGSFALPINGGTLNGSVSMGAGATFTGQDIYANGTITSSGAGGFASASFQSNTRNPIWRFSNADSYGLSYFQSGSGMSGNDTIGFHFGTPTASGSKFSIDAIGTVRAANALVTGNGTDGEVTVGNNVNGAIELGMVGRVNAGTPFIDFHSSANSPDYDVRIMAQGGTSANNGQGILNITAASLQQNGYTIWNALNMKPVVQTDGYSQAIGGSDLNGIITSGFYRGANIVNAPDSGWWYVVVEGHDTAWTKQTATAYGSGNTYIAPGSTYIRTRQNNSWSGWVQVSDGGYGTEFILKRRRNRYHVDDGTSINNIVNPEMGFDYDTAGAGISGPFLHFGGLSSYADYSCQIKASYNDGGNNLKFRTRNNDVSGAPWNAWKNIWHDGNISFQVGSTPNTAVLRDPNGYIFGSYISMSDDGNPGTGLPVTSIITKRGDNYYRSTSAQDVKNFLGLGTIGTGKMSDGANLNSYMSAGFYAVGANIVNSPGAYGQLLVMANENHDTTGQIYISYSDSKTFVRSANAWGANWQPWKVLLDSNNEDVVQYRSAEVTTQDWNGILGSGIYRVTSSSMVNGPAGYNYGTLVIMRKDNSCTQTFYPHQSYGVFIRTKWNDTDWSPWRQMIDSSGAGATGTWNISVNGGSNYATSSGTAAQLLATGNAMTFNWQGQGGQPAWLWGGTDSANMYVWNPSNFSVNYAASAGNSSNTSSISNAVGNSYTWTGSNYWQSGSSGANTSNGYSPSMMVSVQASTGGGAFMAFHRVGDYAINMGLDSDRIFRIGGWSAAANLMQLNMSGDVTFSGNVAAYSDERKKTNWRCVPVTFVNDWANVKSGIYDRIDSGETQAGLSAQAVQRVLPEVVNEDADGFLSLNYGAAAAVATVELAKEVIELRRELAKQAELIKILLERGSK